MVITVLSCDWGARDRKSESDAVIFQQCTSWCRREAKRVGCGC